MKAYISILILTIYVSSGLAQTTTDLFAKYEALEKTVCGKQITDDQLGDITTKCKCDNDAKNDELIKNCLKVTTLTNRQRVTSICDKTTKECLAKVTTDALKAAKTDVIAANIKAVDLYTTCVKGVLKV